MFRNFQLYYDGRPLTGEKLRDTYFTSLMQILLHNVSTGVSRDYLEDVLLGDRDVENRHQALQTIVYKAKKKLRKMGLPDVNYIFLKDGVYHWTLQIPVSEDAAVFDEQYRKAKACEDEEERLRLYLEACYQYKGEFLSTYTAVLWAGAEARRYRRQFCECVENAAALLRKKEDWIRLEEFGRYVMETAPFSNWETLVMEALMERGRYEEARKLYADTVDYYLREQGAYPSTRLVAMMEKLGRQMKHSYAVLDQIQKRLEEGNSRKSGGYQCSYPVFRGIYHALLRLMERGGQSAYLMLCTLVDSKGNPVGEGRRQEEMSSRLLEAIGTSVRHGDIINQYGNGQFLILLINTTREDCEIIENRINQKFVIGRQRAGVQYHVNSVICEA
ncbi:MAG: hypothetical protein HFI63_08645 [Lachnospiraceae bacterium]|nr:hypothetical protein [Lachnospiraceae bacterium]